MMALTILSFIVGACLGALLMLELIDTAHGEPDELPGDPSREWKEGK